MIVDLDEWERKKEPAAICLPCDRTVPDQVVQTIYRVRCELAGAKAAFEEVKLEVQQLRQRMDGIAQAQKELEEVLYE